MANVDRLNERLAREIVSQTLNAEVLHHDDNSQDSMFDALIRYKDGSCGALEIVGDHDESYLALVKALQKHGDSLTDARLNRGWIVYIEHDADVRAVWQRMPAQIVQMEGQGCVCLDEAPDRTSALAESLRVVDVRAVDHISSGTIQLRPIGWSGVIQQAALGDWAISVLEQNKDVVEKLRRAEGVVDRHAFIWSTMGSDFSVQSLLEHGKSLDNQPPPELPTGIDVLWIAGSMTSQGVVYWTQSKGWVRAPWVHPSREALTT